MESSDKKDILAAIAAQTDQFTGFRDEVRGRFDQVESQLSVLDDNMKALNSTIDTLIEGDTLGKEHITLTRGEYDALVKAAGISNRFGVQVA